MTPNEIMFGWGVWTVLLILNVSRAGKMQRRTLNFKKGWKS